MEGMYKYMSCKMNTDNLLAEIKASPISTSVELITKNLSNDTVHIWFTEELSSYEIKILNTIINTEDEIKEQYLSPFTNEWV